MRGAVISRVVLAGPVAAGVAVVVVLAMPLWVPAGAGRVDNLVLPQVLFPLIWAGLFFHACIDASLRRVAIVALALALLHGAVLGGHLMASSVVTETRR